MRFEPESLHGANAGLNVARGVMEEIKAQFPWISYGDLWTLGGVAAVQVRTHTDIRACGIDRLLHRKWLAPRSPGEPAALMASQSMLLPMAVFPTRPRARLTSAL
jgi:hypothetical protein